MLFHYRLWFPNVRLLDHAYLAVDFFFILSGYVLAHAYQARLQNTMTISEFVAVRAIRLYPLLILGTCIGFADALLTASLGIGDNRPDVAFLWFILGSLGLPIPWGSGPARQFFPLNWPAWSLFFEMVINLAFALFVVHLSKARIWMVVLIGAVALGYTAWKLGQINLGRGWWFAIAGLARSATTFFLGVALFGMRPRTTARISKMGWGLPTMLGAVLFVATLLVPGARGNLNAAYDMVCVLLVFPLIIFVTSLDDTIPSNSAAVKFGRELSYAIYILHFPCLRLAVHSVRALELNIAGGFEWLFLAGLTAFVIASALAAVRLVDNPVRKRLTRRWLEQRGSAA